jgi:hypothetical protein
MVRELEPAMGRGETPCSAIAILRLPDRRLRMDTTFRPV